MIVKVCGMRDAGNIKANDEIAAVDWMGFIFYPRSSRYVSDVPAYLPERSKRVGVFVNATSDYILEKVQLFHLDMIQLHGQETPSEIAALSTLLPSGTRIIKMIAISSPADMAIAKTYEDVADYLLFETKCHGYGGSGQQFDWNILQLYNGHTPFILTGGIGPEDAERVKAFSHPRLAGIDINSRFETVPAMKDVQSVRTFAEAIKEP